jgi:hypothetical protein
MISAQISYKKNRYLNIIPCFPANWRMKKAILCQGETNSHLVYAQADYVVK